jgi:hypothetical protein
MTGVLSGKPFAYKEERSHETASNISQGYESNYFVPSSYPRNRSRNSLERRRYVETARVGNFSYNVYHRDADFEISKQVTRDELHTYFYQSLRDNRRYENLTGKRLGTQSDLGGRFESTRYLTYDAPVDVSLHYGTPTTTIENTYNGKLHAYNYNFPVYPAIAPIPIIDLHAYGNKARDLINPSNPSVDLGQDIGELRSLKNVPSVPLYESFKDRASSFKNIRSIPKKGSDEYLNWQFGWAPLVSDIRDAVSTSHKTLKLLRQYERNRGKVIRRRFSFPEVYNLKTTDMGSKTPDPVISSTFYSTYQGKLTKTTETIQRTWFSGAFTYYVSPGLHESKMAKYEAQMNILYGTRLTPKLLWELAPWTWLSDWFIDIGSLINNLQSLVLDGSVMWYGYVMSNQVITDTYSLGGYVLKGAPSPTLTQSFSSECKQRVRATPFGFGASPNSFNMKQWSILAALGISRV